MIYSIYLISIYQAILYNDQFFNLNQNEYQLTKLKNLV